MSQMVTTCANCRQQLAVTAADLRVGQGYVRCGRCDKVFNALLTLTEDAPAPAEPDDVARGTRSVPALDEQDVLPPLPPGDEPAADDLVFEPDDDEVEVVQTHATGQFRSIVMEGDAIRPDQPETPPPGRGADQPDAQAIADDERDSLAREILLQATSQPIDILLEDGDAPAAANPPDRASAPPPPAEDFDADAALGNRPRRSRLWHVAAVLLLLALAGQHAHHSRQQLVTVPWLERPLQQLYGLLGRTVEPPWDLAWYEVPALGEPTLSADARTVVLRAAVSVKKDAPWAQPPPMIRAVLSDRWGNELATTDVAPQDWLLGPAPARIAPGQRLDAQLSLPAPQLVSGVLIYPCLPDEHGTVRCRDDYLQ